VAGFAIAVSGATQAQISDDVVKIGVLTDMSTHRVVFVIARSVATKQSSSVLGFWIASLRSQ
jgi:hypothetical protein